MFSSRSLEVAWQRMIAELEAEEEVHRSVDVTCVLRMVIGCHMTPT